MKWLLPKRSRTTARLGARNDRSGLMGWTKYDESTGQVYSETTATIPTWDDRDWARDSQIVKGARYRNDEEYNEYVRLRNGTEGLQKYQQRLDGLRNSRIRGIEGARSLQDAAIECVLENISDITIEGIECLPNSILRRLWHAVTTRCSMSFNTWSIFSKVLRQEVEYLYLLRYHQKIDEPNCRLEVYNGPLTSNSFEFITSLSITTSFPVPDLLKLSTVMNLGVLEIVGTNGEDYSAVGDRLLRSWHLAAVENGAFSVLRIMRLWSHEGLTEKSLTYLNGFPALAVYDVKGCSFRAGAGAEATRIGWKATLAADVLGLLEKACEERALLMRTKLGIRGSTCLEPPSRRLHDGAKVRRIPRADVPELLARRPVSSSVGSDLSSAHKASETKPNAGDLKKEPVRKSKDSQRRSEPLDEAWDLTAYKSFARIGELRNDTDLFKAGVTLGDQAIVGDQLVNSVPVASLRLGKSHSPLKSSSTVHSATRPPQDLAFVRIKVPLQECVPVGESHVSHGGMATNLVGSEPSSTQASLVRREASGIVRNKKRKLEDVLGSFL